MLPRHETRHVRSIVDKVSKIKEWIQKISESNEALGGYSICPYAGAAKYSVTECDLKDIVWKVDTSSDDIQIFIVEDDCTLDAIVDWRNALNRRYKDYLFLDDHIDEATFIQGIQSNFGKGNIMIAQRRDELYRARNTLHKTEYYSYWSEELYGRILNGK